MNVALASRATRRAARPLDLVSVDLYTGTARLFKAGAAPGFLVHGGKVRAVGEAACPWASSAASAGRAGWCIWAAGDYVVLVSDGS